MTDDNNFWKDTMVLSILGTLGFNMVVASLYIIIFLCLKKYCSKEAKDKAQ